MKKLLFCLFFAPVFASCSNGRNDLATSLVNEKKALSDSIKDATNYEHYYYRQAKASMREIDTNLWKRLIDTSSLYGFRKGQYQARLEAVAFSLDSLSKQN